MYKQNLHTHTSYTDGTDAAEALVLEAIDRGFDSIGFSEHSFVRYSKYPRQLTEPREALYGKEIRALREKYKERIDIFCGLEYEFYSETKVQGYDYLIGSVHYLDCGTRIDTFDHGLAEARDYIKEYFGGNGLAFAKKYFETVSRLPERGQFDILGHFDLLRKNNDQGKFFDTSDKEYLALGFAAIHALRGKIPLFELNTGAIARGYTLTPYPAMEFLKEFLACGFGAVITSDCHNKAFLDCHFDEAHALLRAAGFRSKWILTQDGFKEIAI